MIRVGVVIVPVDSIYLPFDGSGELCLRLSLNLTTESRPQSRYRKACDVVQGNLWCTGCDVRTIYESDLKSKDDGNCGEQRDPLGLLRRRHVGLGDGPIRVKLVGLLSLNGWAIVELLKPERLLKKN